MQITAILSSVLLLTGVLAQGERYLCTLNPLITTDAPKSALDNCYDNQCKDYHDSDEGCVQSSNNNATEYYSCVCPKMFETINDNGGCVDCLNKAGEFWL